jgi:catalase
VVPDSAEALEKLDFSVLDATKVVDEERFPFRELGRLVLTRNPDNHFAEVEQVAFCPANLVPGIELTNDPLLQGRLFSYLDTQISRLGVNFHQLPINRPRCPFSNHQRDGKLRASIDPGVAYHPNTIAGNRPLPAVEAARGDPHAHEHGSVLAGDPPVRARVVYPLMVKGAKVRARPALFERHFDQAARFFASMSEWERAQTVAGFAFELNQCASAAIRERFVLNILAHISDELALRVARRVGVEYVAGLGNQEQHAPLASLSAADRPFSRKHSFAALVVGEDTPEETVRAVRAAFARAEMTTEVVGVRGDAVKADVPLSNAGSTRYEAVVVVCGDQQRCRDPRVRELVGDALGHGKVVVDAAGCVLQALGAEAKPEDGIFTGEAWEAAATTVTKVLRFYHRQIDTIDGMGM